MKKLTKHRYSIVIAALIVINTILSIIFRLPYLQEPIMRWRDTQTAITTYWFLHEGISLIKYQTPIFVGAFRAPFEFPMYQAFSAFLHILLPVMSFLPAILPVK